MAIFHCYVSSPEGTIDELDGHWLMVHENSMKIHLLLLLIDHDPAW